MERLDELLIRDWFVPEGFRSRVVYHYTTATGLIGILSAGYLRGTNASFLNDTSEIEYGQSICLNVLEEERTARSSDVERPLLERVISMMQDDALPDEVYVTSFSARRDVLSQWRAYGSTDGRFCIGFQLAQFSERDVLRIPRPVEYLATNQREQVRRAIDVACQTALEAGDDPRHAWSCVTSLAFHLRRIMCLFKHSGFSEEQEWRSVTTMSPMDDLRPIQFEAVRGVPRPFIAMLAGSRASTHLPIIEVCIGHAERKEATSRATRLLLARYGYANATVTETETPFAG